MPAFSWHTVLLTGIPAASLGYLLFNYSMLLCKWISRLAIARYLLPDCDPALLNKQPVAVAGKYKGPNHPAFFAFNP